MMKLAIEKERQHFTYARFGEALAMSTSEIHAAVARAVHSGLVTVAEEGVTLVASRFAEFLFHGAIYCFPAVIGTVARGLPTSYAAPPLRDRINQPAEMPPVWPDPKGSVRGIALYPLYPSVPTAAKMDEALYEHLALFDALRHGAARERELAQKILRETL